MKKLQRKAFALMVLFLSSNLVFAQEMTMSEIDVSEEIVATEDVPMDAWVFNIKDQSDHLLNHFQDFIKEGYDQKVKKVGKNVWAASMISEPAISNKRADIKLVFFPEEEKVGLVWLMGYDYWANSIEFPAEMDAFRTFAIGFQEFHHTQLVSKSRVAIIKVLEKDDKDLKSLSKEKSLLEQSVAKAEEKIDKLKGKKRSRAELKIAQSQSRNLQIDKEIAELQPKVSAQQKEIDSLNQKQDQIEKLFDALRAKHASTED